MKKFTILLALICLTFNSLAQSVRPKREFRGAWIATVLNLDWPASRTASAETQKTQLINILDELKSAGINAVMFQIRPESDALYSSSIEPWSYWLTGQQGKAPNPFYDPLQFAIEQAHKRAMELHAWINPYRADRNLNDYPVSDNHVTKLHPEWILTFSNFKMLDPGLQQVRDYITSVIMDVTRRYDIDGIHFDDFFYPYPPDQITNQDANTFEQNSRGFFNIDDWRRDNVNLLIKEVHDSLLSVKPFVKFGISPFGIWKNGVPAGIIGLDAYSVIYSDALAWLQNGSVDYIMPQLYWKIGGNQDYGKLLPWWADQANLYGRHLYPGHLLNTDFSKNEIPNQIKISRANSKVLGDSFFRSGLLVNNTLGLSDSLKNNYYSFPALMPVMDWKDNTPPNNPENFRFDILANSSSSGFIWEKPSQALDGDTAYKFVIYKFNNSNISQSDLDDPKNILAIVNDNEVLPASQPLGNGILYLTVTALDRNNNESTMSNIISVTAPENPVLVFPADNASFQPDTIILKWNKVLNASFYHLQVSDDSTFSTLFLDENLITDTSYVLTGMSGQVKYFWRVNSLNIAGEGSYSTAFSFITGFPTEPVLLDPPPSTLNVSLTPTLIWRPVANADSYRLQISKGSAFISSTMVFDSTGITDTSFTTAQLLPNQIYFWRVKARNQYGSSNWSIPFGFKTGNITNVNDENNIPEEFALSQNYPNPFNPSTTIKYSIASPNQSGAVSSVQLKVYDVLGREIATLVNERQPAGNYTVTFDAGNLSSGVYFYQLRAGSFVSTKKMILMR